MFLFAAAAASALLSLPCTAFVTLATPRLLALSATTTARPRPRRSHQSKIPTLITSASFSSPNSESSIHSSSMTTNNTRKSFQQKKKISTNTSTKYLFEDYNKPIVLIGLSSSQTHNELQRLALSLSGALVGNNLKKLQDTLDMLQRSQGVNLLNEDDDDHKDESKSINNYKSNLPPSSDSALVAVTGISLSVIGIDDEGPYVFDAELIRELIREKTLSLTTGVLVIDFNHPVFTSSSLSEEYKVDLIRALSMVAKELYEDEKLISVYVNVQLDDDNNAKERKCMIEEEVLIPFSDYELCIKNEGAVIDETMTAENESSSTSLLTSSSWSDIEWELHRMIARAFLPPPIVGATANITPNNNADLTMGKNTFFLSLSFPKIEDASPYIEQMCRDVDSMEYRVDLLSSAKDYLSMMKSVSRNESSEDPRFDILYQQQRLRALCRPHAHRAPALPLVGSGIIDNALPIVYTVRTAHQAGTWPDDDEGIRYMFQLLDLGLRSAVEVLDVESAWDAKLTDILLRKAKQRYTSLILGSHHVVGSEVSMEEAIQLFRQCRMNDRAHGAKVVLSIRSNTNDEDQLAYKASVAASKLYDTEIPNIGLILGEDGSYSRILNPRFTPVTHECLPSKAAPGQLTAAEIMAARMITGLVPTERYAILGHNIAYSVSPQMQGAAFAAVKLPHSYSRADVESVEEFVKGPLWNDEHFGGCSVTIPHKQNIIPHVDVLTDAAKEISSVNTVIVKKDKFGARVLIGDNTDWRGIYNPLKRRLGDDNYSKLFSQKAKGGNTVGTSYALILGAGGTARAAAYAASKLGLERIYYNRTPEKAIELANAFGGIATTSLDDVNSINIKSEMDSSKGNDSSNGNSLGAILSKTNGSVKVIISTLPASAEFQLPDWMIDSNVRKHTTAKALPIVFDVNYKPYNTKLILEASKRGCDVIRGSEMLWEQGVGQFELWTGRTAPYGVMKRVVLENCLPSNNNEENEK